MKTAKHMKKYTRKKLNGFICIYSCIFVLSLCVVTLSKYTGIVQKESQITIGKPIAQVSIDNTNKKIYPSGTAEFEFEIQNYKEEEINEVLLRYALQIENISDLNLTYEVYEISEEQKNLIDIEDYHSYLHAGTKENKQYIISITWDDDSVDISSLELENMVHIEVTFVQVLERE